MSACFAWSVVVTSALKNFNYSSCYEHIPLGKYNFRIFELICVSTLYFLLRATCLMVWKLSYLNFSKFVSRCYWWDSPVCQSFFSPKGYVHTGRLWARSCARGGWIQPQEQAAGWLQCSQKGKISYWVVIIALRQSPVTSGHLLHARNFGVEDFM